MDSVLHHSPSQSTLTPASSARRRSSRENETPQQRQKREKAAERQRRKRERDRHVNNLNAVMAYPQPTDPQPAPQPQTAQSPTPTFNGQDLAPEELARRERIRAAARERQRKHRSIVKQRKMRELGLEMTGELMPGMEEVQFRVNGDHQYPHVMHELPHPHPLNPQDSSFPPPSLTGGQSFASTLLLSLSFAPLLKQHIQRSLPLTNEELASLEPVIADAFDQWNHQRHLHYAQQAAVKAADGSMPGPSGAPFANVDMGDPSGNSFVSSSFTIVSLVAPSPFRNFNPGDAATATESTPTTPGSGPSPDPIDPHLSAVVVSPSDSRQKVTLDPEFGQGKGEAEGVVDRS
ncbi:hypothetical protein F5I97DRAFT_1992465 [Phlebopus sp. FC_14]|nr:hypothetical protein F5I97DRAFT_1992465 [Phlebopus sp. FC_14]